MKYVIIATEKPACSRTMSSLNQLYRACYCFCFADVRERDPPLNRFFSSSNPRRETSCSYYQCTILNKFQRIITVPYNASITSTCVSLQSVKSAHLHLIQIQHEQSRQHEPHGKWHRHDTNATKTSTVFSLLSKFARAHEGIAPNEHRSKPV